MRRALLLFALLVGLSPSVASAYTGSITGRLLFYDTRTNAANPGDGPYTTAMRYTWRPLRYLKVYAVLANSSTVLGTGATDQNGDFRINWASGFSNPSVSINFYYESAFSQNGYSRFRIAKQDGGRWVAWTPAFTAPTNVVKSSGSWYFGSTTQPDKLGTMFTTATDFWVTVGSTSNSLVSRLYNVVVRFPEPNAPTGATFTQTDIGMADNWVVFNNSTLAHEFGHVVQELAFEQNTLRGDCSWNGNTHSWDSVEYQSCASIEGFADFVAAATFYYQGASNPTSYGYNIEAGCSGQGEWSESNTARMFWDVYDSRNESGDNLTLPFYWFVDKMNVFPDGTGNRQDRETESNRNGLNVWDFYWHALYSGSGVNADISSTIRINCLYNSEW